ncbi:MAG: DNA-binding protein [Chloroflexi bacterium]|nr:DNA-binding protein [Chloroflexota bacterium]
MQVFPAEQGTRTYMVSFRRGEYIIEALREFLQAEAIDAALITSGIGSFDRCRLHTITNTGLPPEERYLTLEGPLEVGSLQGSVAGGEPHIHVVLHDVANDVHYVGHLEDGSRCCFRVELGVVALTGVRTRRKMDPDTQLVDIVPAEE